MKEAYEAGIPDAKVRSQFEEARDVLDRNMERLNEQIEALAVAISPARSEETKGGTEAADSPHHGSSQVVRYIDQTSWAIDAAVDSLIRIRQEIEL